MEALEIRQCPLCWRWQALSELEEVLIREAREESPRVLKRELFLEARESAGITPGRGRQVWYRCRDGVCRERHP